MADISNEIQMFREAVYGEDVRGGFISLAEKVNTEAADAKESAEQAAGDANTAISTANASAEQCNLAASNANAKAAIADHAAQNAAAVADTVQNKLDNGDFVGPQGVQGEPGRPFQVAKVYASVDAMNAGYATDEVLEGQFVVINTGNVEDEDNAKLFLKGASAYEFITDLSGAAGMQGPQGVQGIQGQKGDTGETGPQGPPGSVENLGAQEIAYTEPADPAEGETEVIPASGSTIGTIVGWLMKKVKGLISSVTGLSESVSELNSRIQTLDFRKGTLTASSLDDLSEYGVYWCNFSIVTGSPYTSGYGWLEIIKSSSYNICIQRITRFSTEGAHQMAVRYYQNDKWYPWRTVNLNVIS